jgi:spermidine synthase
MEGVQPASKWFRERQQDDFEIGFRVAKTLFAAESPYQRVEIVQTAGHGAMLINDGVVMAAERDEFVYHEMIAHVPLFVHPRAARVLVIGGGDGGTAREVLKHPEVARVVLVEIDAVVVQACRRFLPSLSVAFEDPRLELVIADGVAFAARTTERFDVVIVDSSDPVGPAEGLFDRTFYGSLARLLRDGGILVTQAESPFYDQALQTAMFNAQREFFRRLHLYLYSNLTYPGGLWAFAFASQGLCPLRDFDAPRFARWPAAMRYYNAGVHRAAFMLPEFVRKRYAAILDPLPSI